MSLKSKYATIFTTVAIAAIVTYQLTQEKDLADSSSDPVVAAIPSTTESFHMPQEKSIQKTPSQGVFDPASLKNNQRLWVDAELLFWQAHMGSLSYGIDSKSTTAIQEGHVKSPDFEWEPGFRVGMGYILPHDKWDLFVNYTHLYGKAEGHAGGSSRVVFPSWASNFADTSPFYADSARAHWHLHLNMGDLELGRNCFAGTWLSLRPFIGVRGLWIDQDYSVSYKGGTVAPSDQDNIAIESDFWGVGLRMGVNSLWGIGKGFSLYGNGSASLLSGNFDIHEKEKLQKADLERFNIKSDVSTVVADADLSLGLQWDYLFSKDRYHFGVKLGWECDIFFNQNQLFNFLGTDSSSINSAKDDLSFQGVTLGFRFDF